MREMGLEEIRQADAGDGERIPILREVFDLARHRAPILLEIKSDFIAERVVQAIAEAEFSEQVVVQSFNPQTVERVKRLAPHLPASFAHWRVADNAFARPRAPISIASPGDWGQHAFYLACDADAFAD